MLTDGDQSVRLTFAIDDEGKITSVSAERWYEPDNGMHTWRAYLRDYQLMAGCRVPTDTEVTWVLDDGEYSYARFKLTAMEPNPDPAASVAHLRR